MNYTIELLMKENENILRYYKLAYSHWREILSSNDNNDAKSLSKKLTNEQMWFEDNCGGRYIGQEIMVVSGISQFYSTQNGFNGKEKNALIVYEAFKMSFCSLEVKSKADQVAKQYYLDEFDLNND